MANRTILRQGSHDRAVIRMGREAIRRGADCAALLSAMKSASDRELFEKGMTTERRAQRRKLLSPALCN